MQNFIYHNPTKLIFGKGEIAKLGEYIDKRVKVMLLFGGGSVKQNGVYDQVKKALKDHNTIEFWGIEPNPKIETLRKAISQAKAEKIDLFLAVGGGSVLDGTKLVAAGVKYDGDPWEIALKGYADRSADYASVMTLSATGSEMNAGAVISRGETNEKFAFFSSKYPLFSILDPQTTYSIPIDQLANGLSDIFVHVLEQYMTATGQSRVMDRWAEGIMQTIAEIAPTVLDNPNDYETRSDYMICAALALNGMIAMGVTQDWSTHMIGHELTALTGIAHGATLAVIYPATLSVLKDRKKDKILQYADRVWRISGGNENMIVQKAISATESFFRSLGLKTRLFEYGVGEEIIGEIVERFAKRKTILGENGDIDAAVVKKILLECK
ncbi:MAG: iron-containing alcohol dehydrogenase [Helicobacteraceae bacterium]|jgi:NADP-dependent alcohol dehydrogenase|nr:iron-containing alcohol dehydrogenase [Helicobacteraceae bacterium]